MRKSFAILGILALALWMPGCSDDDPIPAPSLNDPATLNALAGSTTSTIAAVTLIASGLLGGIDGGADGGGTTCIDISEDACDGGGMAELCGGDTVNLNGCVVTGVGSLSGTVSADLETGLVTFTNLIIDGTATLNGTVQVIPDLADGVGPCFIVSYALQVTSGGLTQNMSGTLSQCDGGFPEGILTVIIPEFNVAFNWFFDGSPDSQFTVTDLTTKETLLFCTYNLVTELMDCSD